jgi:hypothetical protein
VPFKPETVTLLEGGKLAPYKWKMLEPLVWTGTFRGEARRLEVTASPDAFTTDLASVPRSLTWLFPRYGKYTKAAIVHDYLCQNFSKPPDVSTEQSLLPLTDRSDADEMFRHLMAELGVPRLRRWLMWAAVSWATLFTYLVPGRRSRPVLRSVSRVVVLVGLVALAALVIVRHDRAAILTCALALPAALLVGGTIALGRVERIVSGVVMYPITLFFSPLLATGVAIGVILGAYLLVEDATRLFAGIRGAIGRLFSEEAKAAKVATPQFARLAAVLES